MWEALNQILKVRGLNLILKWGEAILMLKVCFGGVGVLNKMLKVAQGLNQMLKVRGVNQMLKVREAKSNIKMWRG